MAMDGVEVLIRTITDDEAAIFDHWLKLLKDGGSSQGGRIREAELQTQAKNVFELFRDALAAAGADTDADGYIPLRETLGDISRSRAIQGFTPTDTANFVLSLKEPIFEALDRSGTSDPSKLVPATRTANRVLDQLGLHTMEVFLASREEVIGRQGQEIAELSTPVVRLWEGIVALPLIGTLDSVRTGVVMENLLSS